MSQPADTGGLIPQLRMVVPRISRMVIPMAAWISIRVIGNWVPIGCCRMPEVGGRRGRIVEQAGSGLRGAAMAPGGAGMASHPLTLAVSNHCCSSTAAAT